MKKFFSAFLLMAAMAFSVSTFVACNDVVGEIEDVKAQTTQNAANIEQLQADLKAAKDEAAAAAAAALQAAKDAQKAGDDAMAYAKAAEASAQKALEEAIAEADAALQAHIDDFNTKYDLINETLGQKADKTELTKAIADLKAELQTEISSVRTSVEELDKKIDDEVSKLNTKIDDNKKAFDKEIADLKAADVAINTELTKLNTYIETVKTDLKKEISDSTKALRDAVAKAVEEMNKIKAELVAEDARLAGLINTNAAEIKKNADAIAQNATSIADLRTDVNGLLEDVNDAKELLAAHAEDLKNLENEISNLKTQFDALTGRVDALFARVQSIVYVPEYSDGKADILYGTINTTAGESASAISDLMIVSHASTLKYKVNAENAAEVASAIAAAKNALSFEVKTVKTRAEQDVEPKLEIVNVTAENGYILVDVYAKNFAKEFFLGKKNMYSAALKLSDGNNNATSEFSNLTAVKVNELTAVVEPASEYHEIPYDKVDTTVVILKGNKVVFYNENGVALTDEQVAKYDLAIERSLKAVQGNVTKTYNTNVEGSVYAESNDEGVRRIYDVTFNTEINDFVVRMGDKFTRKDNGRVFPFYAVYTINGYEISASSNIELTAKQVSFNVPAIVVDWTVAVADELRVNGELYAKDLVRRTPEYVVPENFEGYTLKQIFNTNNEGDRRYVSFNGVEVKQSVTNITATMEDNNTSIAKLKGTYVFPEYNAENEYNEYVLTLVKKLEDLHATITFTFKLGKKAAPVVIDMPATKLGMIGEYPYYFGEADFAGEAYKKFLEFAGYAKEADAKAVFEAAFAEAAAVADEKPNYVTVNGEAGSYNNIDYLNGYVRFYNINKLAEGTQNFVSAINKFWFGVPFTFKTPATLDVPTNLLVYSMGDYVVDVENVKTVYVDAKIVDDVYTVNKSDLAKYFAVSKDADNYNNLDVTFEVKTIDAPKPATSTVEVSVDPNPEVANLVLAKDKAVITDWTNNGQFKANRIEVEAILTVNDAFELDRKPVVLVVKDPLQFAAATPVKVPRYTGEPAVAYPFQGISVKSILEGELVDSTAKSLESLFKSDVNKTYGLTLDHKLARVYYVVGEEKIAYESSKYHYDETTGVVTLYADDAILNTSIFAEIEYSIAHRLNEKSADDCTKTVTVEFYPQSK